jgi:hypothetical protein
MKLPAAPWIWILLSVVTATATFPAATPAATAPAESAFGDVQTVLQSLLARTSPTRGSNSSRAEAAGFEPRFAGPATSTSQPFAGAEPRSAEPGRPAAAGSATGQPYGSGQTAEAWDADAPVARHLLEQSSQDVSYLHVLGTSNTVPADYAESLRQHGAVLLGLLAESRLTPQGFAKLQAVAADLRTKVLHAQMAVRPPPPGSPGLPPMGIGGGGGGAGAFSPIEVRVHTYEQGTEKSGYEVWYVAAAYDDDPSRFLRFLRLSSPTSLPLIVGNYSMWAKAPNGAASAHQILAIGAGRPTQDLDLVVP